MAYTSIPTTITDIPSPTKAPSAITDIPSITDIPAKHGGGGVTNHLLDGSGNVLAITVGVDQLTNA